MFKALTFSLFAWVAVAQNFSPSSRTVRPLTITRTNGSVAPSGQDDVTSLYTLTGPGASITYDFGTITAGLPTLVFGKVECQLCTSLTLPGFECGLGCSGLGVAYTESSQFIGTKSDQSVFYTHDDGTYFVPAQPDREYTLPPSNARGAFRYLTLSTPPSASADYSVEVRLSHIYFDAQPTIAIPNDYSAYFESSDALLNQIWYASAYTVQLSTVAANSSVQHTWLLQPTGWGQDAQATDLSGTDEFFADGAKRDRNPWAGDLGVGIRSSVIYRGDNLISIRNAIFEMFVLQDATTGYFPYCGSPLGIVFSFVAPVYGSDTYHLWTISSFAEYVLAAEDREFGLQYWSAIVRGLNAATSQIEQSSGLFNGRGTQDWARVGIQGESTSANVLLAYCLEILSRAAEYLGQSSDGWLELAENIKTAINANLWDDATGLFYDNTTEAGRSLHPQDGNVLAVHLNATSASRAQTILARLAERHTEFGAPAPELPGAISPFVSSMELYAMLNANPSDAGQPIALMRTQWGYMMKAFSNSTLIEGYGTDGSLNYPFYPGGSAFISHVHAWATGPLYVLSAQIAGLRASVFDVSPEDGDWVFQPAVQNSGLDFVRAGFKRQAGEFASSWSFEDSTWTAEIETPSGTTGTIYVPLFGDCTSIYLDGNEVGTSSEDYETGFVRFPEVPGGQHVIEAVY